MASPKLTLGGRIFIGIVIVAIAFGGKIYWDKSHPKSQEEMQISQTDSMAKSNGDTMKMQYVTPESSAKPAQSETVAQPAHHHHKAPVSNTETPVKEKPAKKVKDGEHENLNISNY